MAYTKIFAIRVRLDERIAYIADYQKTTQLEEMLLGCANGEKAEQHLFESAYNCQNSQTAFREMIQTKMRWNKMGGILGYHVIQSFAPDEVTPEQAHEIGKKLFEKLFAELYEGVVTTHLNRKHLHNHMIINSVSFVTGKKYHSNAASYFYQIRAASDELCRAYGLSIIEPIDKGKSYSEWKADKENRPNLRMLVKRDIEEVLKYAKNWDDFLDKLERIGYEVKRNRQHVAVRHPKAKRFFRLDSLSDAYTKEKVEQRIYEIFQYGVARRKRQTIQYHRYPYHGFLCNRRKYTGFIALYFRYLYLLKRGWQDKQPRKISRFLAKEVIHMERYVAQFRVIVKYKIQTPQDLVSCKERLEAAVQQKVEERKKYYAEKVDSKEKIEQINRSLQCIRKEIRLLCQVAQDVPAIQEQMQTVMSSKIKFSKEREQLDERSKCSSRPSHKRDDAAGRSRS